MLNAAVAIAIAAALALWNALLVVVPTSAGPWRGAMAPPSATRIVLSIAGGVAIAWLTRRQPASVRLPLLAFGLAALPLIPILTGRGLLLLAFQDGTLVLVAAAAAALMLVAALRGRRAPALPTWALALCALLFYAALGTRIPGRAGPQGDEPQYLLLAHSLVHDGDFDLANQFAERQYAAFYGGELTPHVSAATPPGTSYSGHAPGLGALIAPAYALGGYRLVVLFLSALVAIGAALLRDVVRDATGNEWLALGTWAVAALTPPLPVFALAVYPETVALFALSLLLWLRRGSPGWRAALVAAVVGGSLVWLHPKMLPLGAAACGLVLLRVRGTAPRIGGLLAWAVVAGSFLLYMRAVFGRASLSAGFGDPQLSLWALPWGASAQLFDRQSGLLVIAPVWLLAVFGVTRRLSGDLRDTLLLLALAAIPIVIGGSFHDWAGGEGPPGRFPVPSLAPACVFLAAALARRPRLGAALAGIGLGVLLFATQVPGVLRTGTEGEGHLLRELSPVDLNALFPSFVVGPPTAAYAVAALLAGTVAAAWWFRGPGLLAGVAAWAALAPALTTRELVHPEATVLRVLDNWDGRTQLSPHGMLVPERLALPFTLLDSTGPVPAGEVRRTSRVDLPPGEYRLRIQSPASGAASLATVGASASNVPLAEGDLHGGGTLTLPLLLPTGAHGLTIAVTGEQGDTRVEEMRLETVALVARRDRPPLLWAGPPRTQLYRLERGALHVTLVAGFTVEAGRFRTEGDQARLVIDGPPAAVARLTIARRQPHPADSASSGGRPLVLGDAPDQGFTLPLSTGLAVGSSGLLVVGVEARDALVTVEDAAQR